VNKNLNIPTLSDNLSDHQKRSTGFSPRWGQEQHGHPGPLSSPLFPRVFLLFRYISLLLTSLLFLLSPFPLELVYKLLLCGLLFGLAGLTVRMYRRHQDNQVAIKNLTLVETLGITLLVLFTGGLASPFVLYFLNPLIMVSLHLSFFYAWCSLGFLLSGGLLQAYFSQASALSVPDLLFFHQDIILVLILLTLVVQVFARIYYTMEEQSQQLEVQQKELLSSFMELTDNHRLMESLSTYQRESVSSKREEDIFSRLVAVSLFAFPLEEAAVLGLKQPLTPGSTDSFGDYTLIRSNNQGQVVEKLPVGELRDRGQELFSRQGFVLLAERSWIAVPIRVGQGNIIAIYLARLRPGKNWASMRDSLGFFIQFTEQVLGSLRNYQQTKETLYHLSSLYEAMETISSWEDPREIMDLFSNHAWKLTESEKVIFWIDQLESEGEAPQYSSVYSVKGQSEVFPEESWQGSLLEAWAMMQDNPAPLVHSLEDENGNRVGQMTCVPVKSRSRCFGILAALQSKKNFNKEETLQKLSFLAELGAISMERMVTELFSDKLLVLEEQKRIANEIHDNISQNLFSIVYGLQAVNRQARGLEPELQEQLSTIQEVAAQTSKELRLLIYRLSPQKRGDETYMSEIRNYLNGLASINNIQIEIVAKGTEEYLNPFMRGAFFRIIKEATGNSIRHGQCRQIKVMLEMNPFASALTISDDGRGFDAEAYQEDNQHPEGLGIRNMRELIQSLQGTFQLRSNPGEGTVISMEVPTSPVSKGWAQAR